MPQAAEMHKMVVVARESISPAEHLEERLHPLTSFVVLPLFALANAGVSPTADLTLSSPGWVSTGPGWRRPPSPPWATGVVSSRVTEPPTRERLQ